MYLVNHCPAFVTNSLHFFSSPSPGNSTYMDEHGPPPRKVRCFSFWCLANFCCKHFQFLMYTTLTNGTYFMWKLISSGTKRDWRCSMSKKPSTRYWRCSISPSDGLYWQNVCQLSLLVLLVVLPKIIKIFAPFYNSLLPLLPFSNCCLFTGISLKLMEIFDDIKHSDCLLLLKCFKNALLMNKWCWPWLLMKM